MTRTITTAALGAATTVAFAALLSWLLINWITGCGERFPTADGGYVAGECVLVPWVQS